MENLERCMILLGIKEDNTSKKAVLQVCLDKAREDIEAFCRDTFIDANGVDVTDNYKKKGNSPINRWGGHYKIIKADAPTVEFVNEILERVFFIKLSPF